MQKKLHLNCRIKAYNYRSLLSNIDPCCTGCCTDAKAIFQIVSDGWCVCLAQTCLLYVSTNNTKNRYWHLSSALSDPGGGVCVQYQGPLEGWFPDLLEILEKVAGIPPRQVAVYPSAHMHIHTLPAETWIQPLGIKPGNFLPTGNCANRSTPVAERGAQK